MSGRRGRGPGVATQCERILEHALAGHTIHADDWWSQPTPDGGPRMRAVRSRVSDLEAAGWRFHHNPRDDHTVEYRLAAMPEHAHPAAPTAPAPVRPEPEQLPLAVGDLTAPAPRPRLSFMDVGEDE